LRRSAELTVEAFARDIPSFGCGSAALALRGEIYYFRLAFFACGFSAPESLVFDKSSVSKQKEHK
jgi:hypothetical protein